MDFAPEGDENRTNSPGNMTARFGFIETGPRLVRWRVFRAGPSLKKVYIMRSALGFLSVGTLALMLAPLGVAQSQSTPTQGSNSPSTTDQTSTPPAHVVWFRRPVHPREAGKERALTRRDEEH